MKKCKFCKSEIEDKSIVCPFCKRTIKFPVKTWIFLTLLILFISFGFAFLFSINDIDNDNNNDSNDNDSFTYEITNQGTDNSEYSYFIEGIVTNLSNEDYSYIEIEFICYDTEGNNLGTAMANTTNILGKENWKFKAIGLFTAAKYVDHCIYNKIKAY